MDVSVQTYWMAAGIPDIVSYGGLKEHVTIAGLIRLRLHAYRRACPRLTARDKSRLRLSFFSCILFNTLLVRISVLSKMAWTWTLR